MIGIVRVALISDTRSGYGVRLVLQDCDVIERDENLLPYTDMNTDEAMTVLDALVGMMIQAITWNAK